MFLVEKKIVKNDFEKSLHFEGGGQGQFGKSLHFDFFFYDGFPYIFVCQMYDSKLRSQYVGEHYPNHKMLKILNQNKPCMKYISS